MKSRERLVFDTKTIESFKLTSLAFGMGKHSKNVFLSQSERFSLEKRKTQA